MIAPNRKTNIKSILGLEAENSNENHFCNNSPQNFRVTPLKRPIYKALRTFSFENSKTILTRR